MDRNENGAPLVEVGTQRSVQPVDRKGKDDRAWRGFKGVGPAMWLVPAAMLTGAILPLPYGYYVLLRIVVCGAAAFLAWKTYQASGRIGGWTIALGLIAALFNPIVPVYLSRSVWAPIDLAAAAAFATHYLMIRRTAGSD